MPPDCLYLRSCRMYCTFSRSQSARFTVLFDIFKSLAIVEIAGKHCPFLSARSRRYMYTAIARCGRFVEKISRLLSKKSLLKYGIFKRVFFQAERLFLAANRGFQLVFRTQFLSSKFVVIVIGNKSTKECEHSENRFLSR